MLLGCAASVMPQSRKLLITVLPTSLLSCVPPDSSERRMPPALFWTVLLRIRLLDEPTRWIPSPQSSCSNGIAPAQLTDLVGSAGIFRILSLFWTTLFWTVTFAEFERSIPDSAEFWMVKPLMIVGPEVTPSTMTASLGLEALALIVVEAAPAPWRVTAFWIRTFSL